MKIEIRRMEKMGEAIDGTLHIDGQYICDTVENSHTALPAGNYQVERHYCKQYGRFMPIVVPTAGDELRILGCEGCKPSEEEVNLNTIMPCVCHMLKPGNGVHNREDGSIILGTCICSGCLKLPLKAFEPLAERIRKAVKRKSQIVLGIFNVEG